MQSPFIRLLITIFVLVHLVGNLWHGNAHTTLEISLPGIKTAFVIVVILIGPILGGILYDRQGDYVLAFSLAVVMMGVAVVFMWSARITGGAGRY